MMTEAKPFSGLFDFYGNVLATGIGSGFHNGADCFCNLAVAADNHARVFFGNRKEQLNVVALYRFLHTNAVGMIHDSARDIS